MPISMIKPINDGMLIAVRINASASTAPGTDNTSAPRMGPGCTKSLNSSTSTM